MAGTLISATSEHLDTTKTMTTTETTSFSHYLALSLPISAVIDEWEVVEYALFVNYPPLDPLCSTHPSLAPHSLHFRKRSRGGAWLKNSIDCGGASVKLIPGRSAGFNDAVLVVSLRQNILEEHYVSKLHFTWPQVSCVSGFPSRGTRAVFLSYKDSGGQVQKFALRFLTINETEKFISVLKKILEDARPDCLPCAEFQPEVSSQSEFVPLNCPSRERTFGDSSVGEGSRCVDSVDSIFHQVQTSREYEVAQTSSSSEMILPNEAEETLSAFPPSFTSFLMNCCPVAEQGAVKPTLSEDVDVKNEIRRYLKDPSFQDVLIKAEQLIAALGDDVLF